MKKILFFIAITSFCSFAMNSCSDDETVMEKPEPNPNPNIGSRLALKSDKDSLYVDSPVKFTATASGTEIKDATFFVDGEPISGNSYIKTTIGNIKVQAKRAGYLDSEFITVRFDQDPTP